MAEALTLKGTMRAHTDMVTAIATPIDNSDMIVTSSRDKSIILWKLTKEEKVYGTPFRRLTGHSHFVQDVVLSSDSQFALSGSWDGDLRLWDLNSGACTRRYCDLSDPSHGDLSVLRLQYARKSMSGLMTIYWRIGLGY